MRPNRNHNYSHALHTETTTLKSCTENKRQNPQHWISVVKEIRLNIGCCYTQALHGELTIHRYNM